MTLLELLAVIAIFSAASGAILIRLGSVHEDAAFRSFAAAVHDLDHRGRQLALRRERITMEIDQDVNEIRLIGLESGEVYGREAVPTGLAVHVHLEGGSSMVVFDRTGRSRDYSVELVSDIHRLTWSFSGATGRVLAEGAQR